MQRRGRPPASDVLTPSEWRVVEGVRHGLGNAQIARCMGVSVDAVKFHVTNVLQKLGFRRRLEIRHWDGIRRGSPLSNRSRSMTQAVRIARIGQIARSVASLEAAVDWYGRVLGLVHLYTFGNLAFFDCDGLRLMLAAGEAGAGDGLLYFRVEGIHAACEQLRGRGVEFVGAPHRIHRHADGSEEWMAFFRDNEGRLLALMETTPPVGSGP